MHYCDPELQYDFREYDEYEVAHKPLEVRRHLMYVDMAMGKPSLRDFDPMALERMSDADLIELLGADIKPVRRLTRLPPQRRRSPCWSRLKRLVVVTTLAA